MSLSFLVPAFLAGLLFAAVHGPGEKLAMRAGLIWK